MARNLSMVYTAQKRAYGSWVAAQEIRTIMDRNITPQEEFARTVGISMRNSGARWEKIQAASAWGVLTSQLIGKALRLPPDGLDSLDSLDALTQHLATARYVVSTNVQSVVKSRLMYLKRKDGSTLMAGCDCCGEPMFSNTAEDSPAGDQHFCRSCVSNGAVRLSRELGGYISRYNTVPYYGSREDVRNCDADVVTPEYVREHGLARHNGYYYADGVFDVNDVLNNTLFDYHSGPALAKIPGEYGKRKIPLLLGMELEIETGEREDPDDEDSTERTGGDRNSAALSVVRTLNGVVSGYCKAETDGSLDAGFEMITAPAGLDVHAKVMSHLKNAPGIDDMSSHNTKTCGLHVHACRLGMTPLHAAKLMKFVNDVDNERLMRTIARRYQIGSGYAKFYPSVDWINRMSKTAGADARQTKQRGRKVDMETITQHHMRDSFVNERYSAVNFNPEYTVEFRMFRGTLRYETIMACLEFSFAAWHFSKQAAITALGTEDFMKFICAPENRKDTKFLRHYLKAKDFRAFHQAEVVVRPKVKVAAPTQARETAQLDRDPVVDMSHAYRRIVNEAARVAA